jgi:thiazole synthase
MDIQNDKLEINGKTFSSRLLTGTGKFSSPEVMAESIESCGSEIVTVALRRIDLGKDRNRNLTDLLNLDRIQLLPNTSGAATAEEAVRMARLAKASGLSSWVKLEIHPDPSHLMPDPIETLKAAEILVKEGFTVFPYIHADPVLAKRLEEVGCATVMPLAAPIGTNMGLEMKTMIEIIINQSTVPVIVDAGIGSPSHAAAAMELGASACLVNTAIASSQNPVVMAQAFDQAIRAGRAAYLSGLAVKNTTATATSPLTSFLS